ncbi:MAG: hypothetical protein IKR17_06835 [Bacteroidales bacterium]|nr:hypothetical protein [Bacteroidales bacterium]
MIKHMLMAVALVGGLHLMTGCSGNSNSSEGSLDEPIPDSTITNGPLEISEGVVNDMIQNISSPVEMANMILGSGVPFSQQMLNPSENMKNYSTSFKRAINLGAYSADLGYINCYNKNTVVVSYLLAVKELADGINVGQFIDFQMLKRLASNSSNLDSLKQMSVTSFNDMDKYLREQKRANVSTAIIAGAWTEGIYLTCSVVEQMQQNKNTDPAKLKELVHRLGEQKDIVNILKIVVHNYSQLDRNFQTLEDKINELQTVYEGVRITTEFAPPEMVEQDGMLVIVQHEISHVEISDEQIAQIIAKIKELREFIVG